VSFVRVFTLCIIPGALLAQGARWEADSLGNHRAVVSVGTAADAVYLRLDWRRRDRTPDQVQTVLVDARTNLRVRNVARMDINREFGEIVFQPPTAPGSYYLYFLPYTGTFRSPYPKLEWRKPDDNPDRAWLLRNALTPENARFRGYQQLPAATVDRYESVEPFSAFTPMERIASRAELDSLRRRYAWAEYFLFPEERSNPIRLTKDIPQKWATGAPFGALRGTAHRGEYFTFQVGVWAHRAALDSLVVKAADLEGRNGARIPAAAITCFNTEGTDWSGRTFSRTLHVDRGMVQALWFGIDLDSTVRPGVYEGDITVEARGVRPRTIRVALTVTNEAIVARGDDEPARLTRLRWLNSQLAANDALVAPFTPMRVSGNTVAVLGRTLSFAGDGLPAQIRSFFAPTVTSIGTTGRDVLAAPVRLVVRAADGSAIPWTGPAARVTTANGGRVEWESRRSAGPVEMRVHARMEFDGTVEYQVALTTREATAVGDVRLEVPLRVDAARYMMGLGLKGGTRPPEFRWVWDVAKQNQDAVWLGDVNAGVQVTLKDEQYVRPLNTNFYLSKPLLLPRSWGNGGRGGCDVLEGPTRGSDTTARRTGSGSTQSRAAATQQPARAVTLSCFSGQHTLAAGDSLRFDFRLALTPFKPIDTDAQWRTRFFHAFVPVDSIAKRGANTVNVHHANAVNPWINYPFLEPQKMKAYIDSAHARKMKVKIYYTVREITNHAPELWTLRSLGDEVLSTGPGGGGAWLREHVDEGYISAWHVPAIRDAALVTSGVSRWHNFYVEGLAWLVKNVGIDGLYIDDVAFDRTTMKRVRRVLDAGGRGAMIDLHSANQFNPRDGFASSANLYLEHFPFIDRLWFGEYFDYNSSPDYWLVELSGIPFGLMGEMLEKGGNPWRGMTMGMTNRMPWSGDPSPLWKLWDTFGMQGSRMLGWWVPTAPVRTTNPDLLATTYLKPGRALVALGNWNAEPRQATLSIDWKALGIPQARARIVAPAIPGFQEAGSWLPGASIPVPGGKGLILEIR
jgi:hypothetical protein